jgi:hypothetical protein
MPALSAALMARNEVSFVIPERVFIVAVEIAVIASGLAFSPFAVKATGGTCQGAIWFTYARA